MPLSRHGSSVHPKLDACLDVKFDVISYLNKYLFLRASLFCHRHSSQSIHTFVVHLSLYYMLLEMLTIVTSLHIHEQASLFQFACSDLSFMLHELVKYYTCGSDIWCRRQCINDSLPLIPSRDRLERSDQDRTTCHR